MPILSAQNLAKSYKKRPVVIDVSIEVEEAQIVGLLGPNGAGKTTCFYMMVGLVAADKGKVSINGEEVTHLPMHARASKGLGYLPQEASIFRKLSVQDNILAILQMRKDLNKQQQHERLEGLLEEFNVTHIRDSLGMALSGGERRRVEIARALAMEPKIILLDEPFAGVDPISVGDIKEIIHHLQKRGVAVLITDHNVRETLDICEKAYIVGNGHIIAAGTAEEVLSNQTVRDVYLGEQFRL
ncbi:LPS export ABC transporter ATP-binding protein [Reinekea sp.]|jgi:lipopolysaccharide export system ATP-binding protein|uniref:LPS export ABC transporter ATP-binding protein n=1 Tax=Reinekea sp. TaxID=1970455 RepID=UPI003989AD75